MASLQTSNRNVPIEKIPKLKQFLNNTGIKPKGGKYGVVEYSMWFNAFSDQLKPYHNLSANERYHNNSLEDMTQAYKKICLKINNAKRQYAANGKLQWYNLSNQNNNSNHL